MLITLFSSQVILAKKKLLWRQQLIFSKIQNL